MAIYNGQETIMLSNIPAALCKPIAGGKLYQIKFRFSDDMKESLGLSGQNGNIYSSIMVKSAWVKADTKNQGMYIMSVPAVKPNGVDPIDFEFTYRDKDSGRNVTKKITMADFKTEFNKSRAKSANSAVSDKVAMVNTAQPMSDSNVAIEIDAIKSESSVESKFFGPDATVFVDHDDIDVPDEMNDYQPTSNATKQSISELSTAMHNFNEHVANGQFALMGAKASIDCPTDGSKKQSGKQDFGKDFANADDFLAKLDASFEAVIRETIPNISDNDVKNIKSFYVHSRVSTELFEKFATQLSDEDDDYSV